jgi:hypothetical protein
MKKRIVTTHQTVKPDSEKDWLNLPSLAEVELTSEDQLHPIEAALDADRDDGWRADTPGRQMIRLVFPQPQTISHIRLQFEEKAAARTQEFTLRWSPEPGQAFQEIVRQQWNFDPQGATGETEDFHVNLPALSVLELVIDPDLTHKSAHASLKCLQLG